MHQTGNNSGVIHSGIYYKPNSLKAKNCFQGIRLLKDFCLKNEIEFEICGKLIIASRQNEIDSLKSIFENGKQNGIKNLKYIKGKQISNYEPHAIGEAAIFCPTTGIIDYLKVCDKLVYLIKKHVSIKYDERVNNINTIKDHLIVNTDKNYFESKFIINCAGLFSDKIAIMAGVNLTSKIVPFRGEYYKLTDEAKHKVKNLIYPVPNPEYPFLGVHFTRTISSDIEAGPNAVLAFAREGYSFSDFKTKEVLDYLGFQGFWKMSGKYWSTGMKEFYRSLSKRAFLNSLKKLVPDIKINDLVKSPSGVRAQALDIKGNLIDDFLIKCDKNMIHVINAPSPAATSAFAISKHIVNLYNDS